MTWTRGERRRVEISHHNTLPRLERLWSVHVGQQRRAQHLPELVKNALSPASRRMPELLDLGRQRACSAASQTWVNQSPDAPGGSKQEALPFDGGVAVHVIRTEQEA